MSMGIFAQYSSRPGTGAKAVGLALAIVLATPLAACSDDSALTVTTESGSYEFAVEVVDTPESRAKGLMYRESLADDAGMLFDFEQEQQVSFWMMNTLIPLDMIFIGADGVVKNVHVNARPQDPTSIPSDGAVQFVLEIPGGRSREIDLKAGDTIEHERISASES